jgi:hypothetical protein
MIQLLTTILDNHTNTFPTLTVARDMRQLPTQHYTVLHCEVGANQFNYIFLKAEKP